MKTYRFDVVIVGAGPAGVAAAGALAGAGIPVALIEAGAYAGAENWSGCVYFTESLAERDCFGPAAVQEAPYERQVVRRGTLVHNGLDEVGLALTDPAAFRHCYTVLRPVYDPYYALLAQRKGAVLITETTVTSLIRKAGRVVGVHTDRGPLYADVVFLAEGDASHLVRSEELERTKAPHFLQGVKAVLSLPPEEIEKRFRLGAGEGAAFEILIRNALLAGRTAKLNMGGFLYTNRDSLSLGYVAPLDNLKKHYRGDHGLLLEWMRSLPHLRDFTEGARLTGYGTKLIRSGGWHERPVLVEDGLAVGGAATGLGIDIPFPNFTGPAAASGLYFARAVKTLLKDGRSFEKRNLAAAYLRPLEESVYAQDARYLSRWPSYFSSTSVLFGRTADVLCGSARFLSQDSLADRGRFLRGHLLSPRGLRELLGDGLATMNSLRLWKPLIKTLLHPATAASWTKNLFRKTPEPDSRLGFIVNIGERKPDPFAFPQPIGGLLRRLAPGLGAMLGRVYANDGSPMERKLAEGLALLLRSARWTDLALLPAYGLLLFAVALATAIADAFRYYVLKVPAETLLAEPVMAYGAEQRAARDLDRVKPAQSMEAKLGLNSYRVGNRSHIRTRWPGDLVKHQDMAKAGIWWVCPANVYGYDAPLFGRGKVTVNWENCIKCESCWHAEPAFALWGRFTGHRLIYRPRTASLGLLLSFRDRAAGEPSLRYPLKTLDKALWYLTPPIAAAAQRTLRAAGALSEAIERLPASADRGRLAWPRELGRRLTQRIEALEALLRSDNRLDVASDLRAEGGTIERLLNEGRFFTALSSTDRVKERLLLWMPELGAAPQRHEAAERESLLREDAEQLFPGQIVKQWEEEPLSDEGAAAINAFADRYRETPLPAIRALSAISPALGLMAACRFRALATAAGANATDLSGYIALDATDIAIEHRDGMTALSGVLRLVPAAAAQGLLLLRNDRAYVFPLPTAGITIIPTPAIGFRAAGLSDVQIDVTVSKDDIIPATNDEPCDPRAYLAIALGAADYLSRRAKEHAAGRVQFPGQMLDTEGRDGIAKLGAVKAMLGRIEAWKLLLETLFTMSLQSELRAPNAEPNLIFSAVAAQAFSPENGALAYDAGQVFGGFAYSEDDLLSRFYRDSALFRFLPAGRDAARDLSALLSHKTLDDLLAGLPGGRLNDTAAPVDRFVRNLHRIEQDVATLPGEADPALSGNAAALAIGARLVLASIETALEQGNSAEPEAAAAEVLLGLCDRAIETAGLSAGTTPVAFDAVFPMEPAGDQARLDGDYESFCARPGASYRSGTFLQSVFDRAPRYVPEMQLHDENLRGRWKELTAWFQQNCRDRSFDGLSFERHVEKLHNLPKDVIDGIRKNKWLATYIPREEDGLGWRKAYYYVLNSAAGSYGDAGVCLLIMASTSIGTTPVLLGLEEELPRVREELEPLVRDAARLTAIGDRIKRIIATFRNPNPGRIRAEYQAVMRLVDGRIRRTRVVKYLAAPFLRAFYGAGIAGQRGDFGGFMTNLKSAADLFGKLLPDVTAALEELPRRERCHKLFLRGLGHGGVSAFALTEPTAGSDSGGVKTTATLTAAVLSPLPDGRYAFSPTGELDKCLRYLIDADRIEFTDSGMAYRAPDDTLCPIEDDRFDMAAGTGSRSYRFRDSLCEFHDIGQVRRTGKGLLYEYYQLTGAKMWITNGSVATQFSLFALAPEGVTGFMVDRYAEGLKVGADEKKTGQRGSPTNELSFDSVRVPREAVIGYEGHGQVNALETLNVGRCGLAVVAGAISRKVMDEARRNVPPSAERNRLLGEAAAIQFGSESVAYHLIGLFDRPHESVRMESALAKFLCSEDIHEILSLVDRAFGPAGQTEQHLIEKARRDARILNIYEGTNEVQRFLVLKDLIALAADWPELPQGFPDRPEDERAAVLATAKNRLRRHALRAAARFGDAAWSDAMLQPALFPLAGMAGELFRLECLWYRMEWLEARRDVLGAVYVDPLLAAGTRAAERALFRIDRYHRRHEEAWGLLLETGAVPEVRAADAALDAVDRKHGAASPQPSPSPQLRTLAILRPVAEISPDPVLINGNLSELVGNIDPRDLAALARATAGKTTERGSTVDILFLGPAGQEDLLRKAGAHADRLYRMEQQGNDFGPVAAALEQLEQEAPYDLILCGSRTLDGTEGLAPFLAGAAKRVLTDGEPPAADPAKAARAVAAIAQAVPYGAWSIPSFMRALQRTIAVIPSPPASKNAPVFSRPRAVETKRPAVTTAAQAAEFLLSYAAAQQAAEVEAYAGPVGPAELPADPAVWAILDPQGGSANAAVLAAAARTAALFGRKASALIAGPKAAWPRLIGLSRSRGMAAAYCIDTQHGTLSERGGQAVLTALWEASGGFMTFAGETWNRASAWFAGKAWARNEHVRLVLNGSGLSVDPAGQLVLPIHAYEGMLLRQEQIGDGNACITLAGDADIDAATAVRDSFSAHTVDLALAPDDLLPPEPERPLTLEGADVIIDLGYGIRDGGGLALAQELKTALEARGLVPLFGATRKVTQDLKLLPLDAQIGQTGRRVNPRLILALGISGAPQHLDYLGTRAEVLCFNKDPEAPLMKLNALRPVPKVHAIAGDLFVTVREVIARLQQ